MLFDVRNVDYAYADGTPAIEDLSLTLMEGDRFAILGANGSGKSTLLRLLNGLIFPAGGSIRFHGTELSEASLKEANFQHRFRQSVGFVFQNADAQLFNPTVFDEVAFGPHQLGLSEMEVSERTLDVLRFFRIEHLADRPPFRLSGGEKRKVAIASVLSMNPEVVMFDEPFLGLDPRSQSWLVRTIRELQDAGKTTIIATHTLDVVPRIAEKAIVLTEAHEVASMGLIRDILVDSDVLRRANLAEAEELALV